MIAAGVIVGGLAAAPPAVAQTQGRGPQPPRTLRFTEPVGPLLLVGSVALEDGSIPPEPVVVLRVCGGAAPVPQAYTNAKGDFTIELGRRSTPMIDAESATSGGGGDAAQLMGCELRAAMTGYTSDAIDLGARRVMDNPNVGTIVLRPLEGVTGSVFSRTALRASREARKAFEKGHALAADEKLDEAREEYEKAVRLYPEFATAWYELGLVHEMQHRPDDARLAYGEAVAADPEYVKPYRRLSAMAFEAMRWEELAEVAGRVVALDPVSYADAHLHVAASSFFLGRVAEAESSARRAVELDPEGALPNARYVLGVVLLEGGEYAEAAGFLRDYVEMAAPGPDVDRAKSLLEQLEAAGAEPQEF